MTITFTPLHATFVAECKGVDFSKPINEQDLKTIKDGIRKVSLSLSLSSPTPLRFPLSSSLSSFSSFQHWLLFAFFFFGVWDGSSTESSSSERRA